MSKVEIATGGPPDFEAALRVWRSANAARHGGLEPSREQEERSRRYLQKPDSFLFVAREDLKVVGMAFGTQGLDVDGDGPPVPGLCHVGAVFVAPECWGRGVGGALVDAILTEARRRGYERAQLWTHEANGRARRLYAGKGFRRSGRTARDDFGEVILHHERPL